MRMQRPDGSSLPTHHAERPRGGGTPGPSLRPLFLSRALEEVVVPCDSSSGPAVRAPLPPRISRRLPCRLEFFELLWWLIQADAIATLDELQMNGWPRDAALEALDGYEQWICGNVEHAIALGRLAWETATA